MKQPVAETSLSIQIITFSIILLTLVLFIAALYEHVLIWAALALTLILLGCYLYAPVAYEIMGDQLTVIRRINNKRFAPVISCVSIADEPPVFTLRLWGNGGLFAGTGIFWNRRYGVFRAYVTTGNRHHLVLIETGAEKVIISPRDPEPFLTN